MALCGWLKQVGNAGAPSASGASSASAAPLASSAGASYTGGIWGVAAELEYESDSDADVHPPSMSAGSAVGAGSALFAFHEERRGSLAEVERMRGAEYMKNEGFRWCVGEGKNSAGRKVQRRFKECGYWVDNPTLPTIAELRCYVERRFPTLLNGLIEVPFQLSSSGYGLRQGAWFKMVITDDFPGNYNTSWHGGNLYCAESIISSMTLHPSEGSRGHFGIWSHKLSTRRQCESYIITFVPEVELRGV